LLKISSPTSQPITGPIRIFLSLRPTAFSLATRRPLPRRTPGEPLRTRGRDPRRLGHLKAQQDGLKSQIDDILKRLDNTASKSDLDALRSQLEALQTEVARIKSEDIARLNKLMDEFRGELTKLGATSTR